MPSSHFLEPDWPAPSTVRSLCSLRSGGYSVGPYAELNLGDHVGDAAQAVQSNRQIYAQALDAKPVFLKQVHGVDVLELASDTLDGSVADACYTAQRDLACTIMVADCLPVLICNRAGTLVGAAHAGWRGLCGAGDGGVLEQIFKRFEALPHIKSAQSAMNFIATDWLVWLGPCIGPSAFEVGAEVRDAFFRANADAAKCFVQGAEGKYWADLQALARQRLARLGITQIYGNDGSPAWCTVSNPSRFFSHRRDRISGRFAASIWLT